jgi:hydroxymethylglutaryl-CoA lyase
MDKNKLDNLVIYEMILRDGLQSLKEIYNIEQKYSIFELILETGINNIEFGSLTSKKILPQMANSLDLYDLIKQNNHNNYCDLIMLCPSISGLELCLNKSIQRISLLCSVSEKFSWKNLNCSRDTSFNSMLKQLNFIIENDYKFDLIRIYVSGSFGSNWEDFDTDYINYLIKIIESIYIFARLHNINYDKLDIVLSDTFGLANDSNMILVYEQIKSEFPQDIFKYIGLHLHTEQIVKKHNDIEYNSSIGFENLINISLNYLIKKYDSSILGIGGCPFGEENLKGNLSTIDLLLYLQKLGYNSDIDLLKLENNSFKIKKILDLSN